MASLTPAQLQEARIRSGNLGGRPRKPTMSEARDAALAELTPRAIEVLRRELDDGGPQAVRVALRIIDHAWGLPETRLELSTTIPDEATDIRNLTNEQLHVLRRELSMRAGPILEAAQSREALPASKTP